MSMEQVSSEVEVAPIASVRVRAFSKDTQAEGWGGQPENVTLDLMSDGTVRWRDLEATLMDDREPEGHPFYRSSPGAGY